MSSSSTCDALIKWIGTFDGVSNPSLADLSDGLIMARVLQAIDAVHFSDTWMANLKQNCQENWRLKTSNLRKVYGAVTEYLSILNVATVGHSSPDTGKIGNGDASETGVMLQLILGCAINCQDKEEYIQGIMSLPADVQAVAMETITSLFVPESPSSFHPSRSNIAQQLEATTRDRDEAVARIHELESQYAEACERADRMSSENDRLVASQSDPSSAVAANASGTLGRYNTMKRTVEVMQEDLYKAETARDEYAGQLSLLQRERTELASKNEDLMKRAQLAHTLQDEVDALRDLGERATQAETQIETYKKKLEEASVLRRQLGTIQAQNEEYVSTIVELEEDIKKSDNWRPQLEVLKKEIASLRTQLNDQTCRGDKLAFDCKKLQEKNEALSIERDRVSRERESLRERIEELSCESSVQTTHLGDLSNDLRGQDQQTLREKLMQLRKQSYGDPVTEALYSDLKQQHDSTTDENRSLKQRIRELESEVDEMSSNKTSEPRATGKLTDRDEEILELKMALQRKEDDMVLMEERYKNYLSKAKKVLQSMDSKANSSLGPDVEALRTQLDLRNKQISEYEKERDKSRKMRDREEKLIASAFHTFGMQVNKQMMAKRLEAVEKTRQGNMPFGNMGGPKEDRYS